MNIWITGCSGFLGTRLTAHLTETAHHVVGISRRPCAGANQSAVIDLAAPQARSAVQQLLQETGTPDVVVHAASKQPGQGELAAFVDANVRATSSLMEGLAQRPPKLIIYTSTLSVYGRPFVLPVNESSAAGGFLPYAATKRWAEQLLETFQRYSQIIVLRLPSLYGAGQEDSFIDGLARTAQRDEPLELFSRGELIRDALHVSDVVKAIHNCLTQRPAKMFSILNLGCGQPVKTIEYARQLVNALKSNSAIIPADRVAPQFDLYADITAARQQIAFAPMPLAQSMKVYADELRT